MIEVKNPRGLRLTQSTDGIFLHFTVGEKKCGVELKQLLHHGNIANDVIQKWAENALNIKGEQEFDSEVISTTYTTITCPYTANCCGCLDIIYSSIRGQLKTRCNECGKVVLILNSDGYLIA